MIDHEVSVVAAISKNGVIGWNGGLAWNRIPIDMKRFKRCTLGKACIMGRKTYKSIGRALPGRENIVVSSDPKDNPIDCYHALNVHSAMKLARSLDREIAFIGGHSIFAEAFNLHETIRLHLTIVDIQVMGDVYFPWIDSHRMRVVRRESVDVCEGSEYRLEFIDALYHPLNVF